MSEDDNLPDTQSDPRGIAYRALHLAVPACLITLVVMAVGAEAVWARLRTARWGWVVAGAAMCSVQILLCALRWRLTAAPLGLRIPVKEAIAEYYLSSLINTTVPGGVVGDAWRAVRSRGAAGLERAAQSVVIERMAGQIALGAVLLLGLAVSGRPGLQWIALAVIVVLVTLALGLAIVSRSPLRARLAHLMPAMVRRFAGAVRDSWRGPGPATAQIGLSGAIVAVNIAAFLCAARATGTVIGLVDAILVVPLTLFAMVIPLSVAGWGYREGAAAAAFPLIGLSSVAGVSASVVFGIVVLLAGLPGLVVALRHHGFASTPPSQGAAAP